MRYDHGFVGQIEGQTEKMEGPSHEDFTQPLPTPSPPPPDPFSRLNTVTHDYHTTFRGSETSVHKDPSLVPTRTSLNNLERLGNVRVDTLLVPS